MEGFWPVIIIAIISTIFSLIKKANVKALEEKKVTHFDSKGRPINMPQAKPSGIGSLIQEFQKLKENAELAQRSHGGQVAKKVKFDDFPETIETDREEISAEILPVNFDVSLEDRIIRRDKSLDELFTDESHPIFKSTGNIAESTVNRTTGENKIFKDMFKKENLIRAIIMNEAIFNRKCQ